MGLVLCFSELDSGGALSSKTTEKQKERCIRSCTHTFILFFCSKFKNIHSTTLSNISKMEEGGGGILSFVAKWNS